MCWNTETKLLLPLQLHAVRIIMEASQLRSHTLLPLTSTVEIFMLYWINVCIILFKIIRMEGFQCALKVCMWHKFIVNRFFPHFQRKCYITITFLAHSVQFSRY